MFLALPSNFLPIVSKNDDAAKVHNYGLLLAICDFFRIFARFFSTIGKMIKTGLYFGSFNPIHIGHLIIAEYMLEHSDLDELWFVVSPRNPLKKKDSLLDDRQRLYMVNLAIGDDERFQASDIEFHLPQPSYTCHTLVQLKEKHPMREFSLIMGEDNLQTFDRWLNYEWILENFHLYVYPRPGFDAAERRSHPHVTFVDAPRIELSSTLIRNSIKEGREVRYMIPEAVRKYIEEMGFYKH